MHYPSLAWWCVAAADPEEVRRGSRASRDRAHPVMAARRRDSAATAARTVVHPRRGRRHRHPAAAGPAQRSCLAVGPRIDRPRRTALVAAQEQRLPKIIVSVLAGPSTAISGGSTTTGCRGQRRRPPGAVPAAMAAGTCFGSTPPAIWSSAHAGRKASTGSSPKSRRRSLQLRPECSEARRSNPLAGIVVTAAQLSRSPAASPPAAPGLELAGHDHYPVVRTELDVQVRPQPGVIDDSSCG